MRNATAKLLVGRRIVGFRHNPWSDGRGGTAHNPVIELDNGAVLTFTVEETDCGEYGVCCSYTPGRNPR